MLRIRFLMKACGLVLLGNHACSSAPQQPAAADEPLAPLAAMERAAQLLQEPAVDTTPQTVSREQLLNDPEAYLGDLVQVAGEYYETWRADDSREVSYHSLLVTAGPTFVYLVAEGPTPTDIQQDAPVRVTGRFAGDYSYQARNGEMVTAPLLAVTAWEVLEVR